MLPTRVHLPIHIIGSPEPKPNYVPKRLESILPVYLLTFSIGSPEVLDAELINAEISAVSQFAHLSPTSIPKSFLVK